MATYKDDLDILKAAEKADTNKLTFNAITELDNKGLLGRYGGSGGSTLLINCIEEGEGIFTLDKTWKEIHDAAANGITLCLFMLEGELQIYRQCYSQALAVYENTNVAESEKYQVYDLVLGIFFIAATENDYPTCAVD